MNDSLGETGRSPALAAELRIHERCTAFEAAWDAAARTGQPLPRIGSFLRDTTGLERLALCKELVLLDLDFRRDHRQPMTREQYLAELPQCDDVIEEALAEFSQSRDETQTSPSTVSHAVERSETAAPSNPVSSHSARSLDGKEAVPHLPAKSPLAPKTPAAGSVMTVGPYVLLERLGGGGMGSVHKAWHPLLKRYVAIKLIKADLTDKPAIVERFVGEMAAIGGIDHPHLVRAYDAGHDADRYYLVLELVEGPTVARLCEQVGQWPLAEASEVIRQAAIGLQAVHKRDLVHRDIKPSNLMVTPQGTVKVLDLGLALLRPDLNLATEQTHPGDLLGTMDYMAPEQAGDSHAVDIRSDVYSLGCTLYHLLAGQAPFGDVRHPTALSKLAAHAQAVVPSIKEFRDDVPDELVAILQRMLAKSPRDRFSCPEEIAETLQPFAEGGDLAALWQAWKAAATPKPVQRARINREEAPVPAVRVHSVANGVSGRSRQPLAVRRWSIVATALALVLAACAGVIYVVTDQGTLEIKTSDPDVQVTVMQDGREITVVDLKTQSVMVLRSGQYRLILPQGGGEATVTPERFVLRRGQTVVAEVRHNKTVRKGVRVGGVSNRNDIVVSSEDTARSAAEQSNCALEALSLLQSQVHEKLSPAPSDRTNVLLRSRLLEFVRKYAGTTEAVVAGGLMSQVAWPVDALRHDEISAYELRAAGDGDPSRAPKELVAVLGDTRLAMHWTTINCITYSPNGRLLATASDDHTVKIWDVVTELEVHSFVSHTEPVKAVAFSPEGGRVASGGQDGFVRIWDLATGQELLVLAGRVGCIWCIAFSPTGNLLAWGGNDGTIVIWDLTENRERRQLLGHTGSVLSLAFRGDGETLVSGAEDETVRLWSLHGDQVTGVLRGHTAGVRHVAFQPQGSLIASGSWDSTVRLWDQESGETIATLPVGDRVSGLAFRPDGKQLVTGGFFRSVKVWDIPPNSSTTSRVCDSLSTIWSVAWSPDGEQIAAGGGGRSVYLLNAETGRDERKDVYWPYSGQYATVCANGETVACGINVRIWSIQTQQTLARVLHGDWVCGMDFSPDGRLLATGANDWHVKLWDASSGRDLQSLNGHTHDVSVVAFGPDGQLLASGGVDRTVRLWSVKTGQWRTLMGHEGGVLSLAFSPRGDLLASGGLDDSVRIWNVATATLEHSLEGLRGWANDVGFSPDGQTLAAAVNNQVRIWDVGLRKEKTPLEAHTSTVQSVSYSLDGKHLASSGWDGTVRIWDTKTSTLQKTIQVAPRGAIIWSVRFTPDSRHVVVGGRVAYILRLAEWRGLSSCQADADAPSSGN